MARPKNWFATKEYNTARKIARTRKANLWKYTRNTRSGAKESGYYVGHQLPMRLNGAQLEQKAV